MAKSGDSPREAREAALQGVWVGVLLAISNAIPVGTFFLFSSALGHRASGFGSAGIGLLAFFAVVVFAPLALALCVRRWQPRWAAIALLLWTGGVCIDDLRQLLAGHVFPAGLIFAVFAFLGSIQAVRGAFRLAQLRRSAAGDDAAKVF
jgi:uncharacterized membrane protein YhaH (DUF805 family)